MRILIVDDTRAIHADFRKILTGAELSDFDNEEAVFFQSAPAESSARAFEIDSAYQGQEALELVRQATERGTPYALVFMDVRMPPGWDGIETTERLWEADPGLQVVICTAYSDYSWEQMVKRLGTRDNLVILKKPFDAVEVLQLTHALCRKWELGIQARGQMEMLEKRVEERTAELLLANNQLRQAQKMEAVGQLAGGVAHDFNNLLSVIMGHSELALSIAEGRESSEFQRCLQQVIAASQKAASLTRQLLAFSRKQALNAEPLSLNEVVRNLAKMVSRIIGEDIELQCTYAPELPSVHADAGMLEQVLMNLVVNARDAMPKGGKLQIATDTSTLPSATPEHPEGRAGEFVRLTVSDNGCGITQEHLPHLFEPFFTTKEIGKGTGLGLATAHGIVKQHDGWIEVASTPGEGTDFQVWLPVSRAAAATREKASNPNVRKSGGERILLVEDEELVRKVTSCVLQKFGYQIEMASCGREALQTWETRKDEIDLLLTDILMPHGMSGIELARELRRGRSDLKVVFMSGYGGEAFLRAARDDSVKTRWVQKPFLAAELIRAIQEALSE